MKKNLLYLFLAGNIAVILYFWLIVSGKTLGSDFPSTLLAIGRLCGLFAVLCALLQFVLMGREKWIEHVFGLDALSQFHHWNGYSTISFVLAHGVLVTTSYAMLGKTTIINQLVDFFQHYEDIWQAEISVILFLSIAFFSVYIVRRHLKYEWWYGIHLLTYLAVILAWGHQLKWGSDFHTHAFTLYWYALYTFVVLNFLFFRFFKPVMNFFRHDFYVEKIEKEGVSAHSIYIKGKNLDTWNAQAGQFVSVRFLDKTFWQHHPFSLSMIPTHDKLRLTVKNSGDFTAKIHHIKPKTKVYIDGPYGSFQLKTKRNKLLFIAGGVGITPIRSLLEKAIELKKDSILLYGSRHANDIIFKKELDTLSKASGVQIIYIISGESSGKVEKGRIDKDKLKRLVPDLSSREVYMCGPASMMEQVNKDLRKLGVLQDHIHFEKFSLH